MTDYIDHASVSAILALQLQDIEDLKQLYAGEDQTDQKSALQAYQDELEREAVTSRDRHIALLFGASILPDEQLPEIPPVPDITPVAEVVVRPHLPDNETATDQDETQQNAMHQDAVQKNDTYHNNLQQDDTHQDAIVHDDTPSECVHQTEIPQDDTHQDDKDQEVQPLQEIVKELGAIEALQEIIKEAAGKSQACLRRIFGGSRRPCNQDDITDPWIGASTDVPPLSVSRCRMFDHIPIVLDQPELENIASVDETQPSNHLEVGLELTPDAVETCIICNDELPPEKTIQLPCEDRYCHDCLIRLFNASMRDESLFPPRCCEQIPLSVVQHLLPPNFADTFQMRQVELSTPNRTYCADRHCSSFINPNKIEEDTGTCSFCWVQTCVICKGYAHHCGDCPQDPAVVSLMSLAAREGLKQCPSCTLMVELAYGCNHITCRCHAEFCYECGTTWKNCDCALFEEPRLLERAEQVVDRDGPQMAGEAREAQIQQEIRRIRHNPDCRHRNTFWTEVSTGNLQCESCRVLQRHFVYECPQCMLRECAGCRQNRRPARD